MVCADGNLPLAPSQQLRCDSGLIDFYTLMNPSEPWGDNDDGLRFLCCVACVPSVIPGTSANAFHVSKVRRPLVLLKCHLYGVKCLEETHPPQRILQADFTINTITAATSAHQFTTPIYYPRLTLTTVSQYSITVGRSA